MNIKMHFGIILIFCILSFIFLIISILGLRRSKNLKRILLALFSLIFLSYSTIIFKHYLHYNQVISIDHDWLRFMFVKYIEKYNELPQTYDDLRRATKNVHILVEQHFVFTKPQIRFLITFDGNDQLTVTFYEDGFDKKNDKLVKVLDSPIYIYGINVKGDIIIDVQEYSISDIVVPEKIDALKKDILSKLN